MENKLSDKRFEYVAMLKNERKYKNIKIKLIKMVCKKYGQQVFSDFSLPNDFDFANLSEDYFNKTYIQNMSIPLSTNNFKMLTSLPKKAINTPYIFNSKDKHIIGQYLLGSLDNKPVLYAFSIVQDQKHKTEDFNLKLDVCVNGKEWVQLARFDSCGAPHPNFYDENSFAKDIAELSYVPTPHMHYCIQRSQILNGTKFDYMPAKHIDKELLTKDNKTMLENSLKLFLKSVNIVDNLDYNAIINNSYNAFIFKENYNEDRFIDSMPMAKQFVMANSQNIKIEK